MLLLFGAFAVLAGGAALALCFPNQPKRATAIGAGSAVVGSAMGLAFALITLADGSTPTFREPWGFPASTLYLRVDALSALFLVVVFLLTALAGLFGGPYLLSHGGRRALGPAWAHYNGLALSMALVVVAGSGMVFLIAWESMALSSFLLVMYEGRASGARSAGLIYLVSAHVGTAFVIAFFALMGTAAGSLDFDRIAAAGPAGPASSALLFMMALVGFGTKAGFVPFHVWLPEAHSAAPSHVSAVMSGAMIKVGIYGLIRAVGFIGPPDIWWGWLLVAVGASSGVLGVLLALAQHDLKRLLAYHSIENIGIIALGLGVGFLGVSGQAPAVAFLGFAGALFHVFNHAVFKSLLFLGAGAVQRAAHTREIERLGGLMRRMPWTGRTFAVGSAAISGLPPLNGFASEFLIFLGAFLGASTLAPPFALPLAAAAGALALIGGLACACFVKAVGIVFLGEPRSEEARAATEVPRLMLAPMAGLAALCVVAGLASPFIVAALGPAVTAGFAMPASAGAAAAAVYGPSLLAVSAMGAAVLALALGLTALRSALLRGRPVEARPTWDCGYGAPAPRMQYTASSFAAPLTHYFRRWTRTRVDLHAPEGLFPRDASLHTRTPDPQLEGLYLPAAGGLVRLMSRALPLQNGRIQAYVLYIVLTLVALLLWGSL